MCFVFTIYMLHKKNNSFKKKLLTKVKKKIVSKGIPVLAVNKMRGRCLSYVKSGVKHYYRFNITASIGKECNWLINDPSFLKMYELSPRLARKLLDENKNHLSHLLKCKSLKEAFAYSMLELNSGHYGKLLEQIIAKKQPGWASLKYGSPEGDIITKNNITFELKVSIYESKKNRFQFNCIRLHHTYMFVILIAYHVDGVNYASLGELYVFKLTKSQLLPFLGSYCSSGAGVN